MNVLLVLSDVILLSCVPLQAGFNMGPMGMGNMDFGQMLNNPALMNMVRTLYTKIFETLITLNKGDGVIKLHKILQTVAFLR